MSAPKDLGKTPSSLIKSLKFENSLSLANGRHRILSHHNRL